MQPRASTRNTLVFFQISIKHQCPDQCLEKVFFNMYFLSSAIRFMLYCTRIQAF